MWVVEIFTSMINSLDAVMADKIHHIIKKYKFIKKIVRNKLKRVKYRMNETGLHFTRYILL